MVGCVKGGNMQIADGGKSFFQQQVASICIAQLIHTKNTFIANLRCSTQ